MHVKKVIESGNEMLKNATSRVNNLAELAKNMTNLNTKWSHLDKKIDAKNKQFSQLGEYINELRRKMKFTISVLAFINLKFIFLIRKTKN